MADGAQVPTRQQKNSTTQEEKTDENEGRSRSVLHASNCHDEQVDEDAEITTWIRLK